MFSIKPVDEREMWKSLMRSTMLASLLLLIIGPTVFAQTEPDSLKLVDTDHPATFTAGEPDTVSFTFNAALDTSVHYRQTGPLGFWQILPADSAVIDSVWLSEDLRSVRYRVDHRTRSDYTWVLENARSADSLYLQRPYQLFYSLRPETVERYQVSGEATTGVLLTIQNSQEEHRNLSFDSDTLSGPALTYTYLTVVLSRQKPPSLSESYDVRLTQTAYAVAAHQDPFNFRFFDVPNGTYWPVLLYRRSSNAFINETKYHTFYTSNTDGDPDSIVVDQDLSNIDLRRTGSGIEDEPKRITAFEVSVYPNPFNNTTNIRLSVDQTSRYAIELYNVAGRKIKTITNTRLGRGTYIYPLDMAGLATGTYVVQVRSERQTITRKINYIK